MAHILCAVCGTEALLDAKGWDRRRFDDLGEPLIWSFLDDEETSEEKWGRCPTCVKIQKKMPIGELPDWAERLIREYQDLHPEEGGGPSREKAFARLWETIRSGPPDV